jgi:hypothetical protein
VDFTDTFINEFPPESFDVGASVDIDLAGSNDIVIKGNVSEMADRIKTKKKETNPSNSNSTPRQREIYIPTSHNAQSRIHRRGRPTDRIVMPDDVAIHRMEELPTDSEVPERLTEEQQTRYDHLRNIPTSRLTPYESRLRQAYCDAISRYERYEDLSATERTRTRRSLSRRSRRGEGLYNFSVSESETPRRFPSNDHNWGTITEGLWSSDNTPTTTTSSDTTSDTSHPRLMDVVAAWEDMVVPNTIIDQGAEFIAPPMEEAMTQEEEDRVLDRIEAMTQEEEDRVLDRMVQIVTEQDGTTDG